MWSDIHSMPLQVAKFWEMQAKLMHCSIDYHGTIVTTHIHYGHIALVKHETSHLPLKGCIGTHDHRVQHGSQTKTMDRNGQTKK